MNPNCDQQYATARQVAQTLGAVGGNQAKASTVTDQIGLAHDALDRLAGAVGCLDERLAPVLSFAQPEQSSTGMNAVAIEPPAIEELNRLISRLHTLASRVDDLVMRARV